MVKRMCVIFPDASVSIHPGPHDEAAAINRARREAHLWNKGEKDKANHAQFGVIEIDLMSFREMI